MLLPKNVSNNFTKTMFSLIDMMKTISKSVNCYSYATSYSSVKSSQHDKFLWQINWLEKFEVKIPLPSLEWSIETLIMTHDLWQIPENQLL